MASKFGGIPVDQPQAVSVQTRAAPVEGQEFFSKGFEELPEAQRQSMIQERQQRLSSAGLPETTRSVQAQMASGGTGVTPFPEERGETRAAQELPELGQGGLLSGENQARVAAIAPVLLATTNPQEISQILTSNFPNIGISQDPGGNLIAANNETGQQVILNKPGLSQIDLMQTLGLGAAFFPAGRGVQGVSQPALTQLASRSAATQAGIEAAQGAAGGEFDVAPIALAGAAAPVGQVVGERVIAPVVSRALSRGQQAALVQNAPTVEQLRRSAGAIYDQVDELGVRIRPNVFRDFVGRVSSTLQREGLDPDLTPEATALLNRLQREAGGPINPGRLETLRRVAGGVAQSNNPADARLGALVIDQVDELVDRLSPQLLTGTGRSTIDGVPVNQALRQARDQWGRARRAEVITQAVNIAEDQASGFENGLRTQFRSILNRINRGTLRGFTQPEIEAMRTVNRGTTLGNTVRQLGKLGVPEDQATNSLMLTLMASLGGGAGFAAGGPAGAAAGAAGAIAIPTMFRRAAVRITQNNADLASAIVRSGNNSRQITRAYFQAIPPDQRNPAELAALLFNQNADISNLAPRGSRLISDALFAVKALSTSQAAQQE